MNTLLRGADSWLYITGMILSNIIVAWISLEIVRSVSKKERERVEGLLQPALSNAEGVAEAHH
jgi:hypothetical protein